MRDGYLEQKVGAFVLIGLILIGGLVITFGQVGHFFKSSYTITAEFPNTSGIIKNAQVLYRGAKIGKVADHPRIANQGATVDLELQIDKGIQLPKNAQFRIGVYGLLGDRFVDIVPPKEESEQAQYLQHGDHVKGQTTQGFAEFLEQAQEKLNKFDAMVVDMKTKLFTEEFVHDFHGSVKSARLLLERGNAFMEKAEHGKGPLHTVVNDQEAAENMRKFIYNLRTSGVLFYKDHFKEEKKSQKNSMKIRKP